MPKQDCLELAYEPLRRQLKEFCDFILEVKKPKKGYTPGQKGTDQKNIILEHFLDVRPNSVKNNFIKENPVRIPIHRLDNFKMKFEHFLSSIDPIYLLDKGELRRSFANWVKDIAALKEAYEAEKKLKAKNENRKRKSNNIKAENIESETPEPPPPLNDIPSLDETEKILANAFPRREEEPNIDGKYTLYYEEFFVSRKKSLRVRKTTIDIHSVDPILKEITVSFAEPEFYVTFKTQFGIFRNSVLKFECYGNFVTRKNSKGNNPILKLKITFPTPQGGKYPNILFGEFFMKQGTFPFTWSKKRPIILLNELNPDFNVDYFTSFIGKHFSKEKGMRVFLKNWLYNIKEITWDLSGNPGSRE